MRNIYLLPTDKPSRLYLGNNGNFVFGMIQTSIQSRNDDFTNQNIYITNSKEIKEGNWCLDKFNQIWKLENNKLIAFDSKGIKRFSTDNISGHDCKKIIITTDQELIKDGVQAIDDEFIQWFVKNPSCEEVSVKCQHIDEFGNYIDDSFHSVTDSYLYKTIIPKEEVLIQSSIDGEVIWSTAKETLEEVAQKKYPIKNTGTLLERFGLNYVANEKFIEGAKWQQEQDKNKYSEEEVKEIVKFIMIQANEAEFGSLEKFIDKKFEQFKKK